MLKVGLTGSIAVGKSFVCCVFRELGCRVLDADLTAREVVARGTAGHKRVVEEFGSGVLRPDGAIDRKRLADIVFADNEKRRALEQIVHPLVIEAQDSWLRDVEADAPNSIAIVDAALMIESGGYERFDKLIVVWCRPEIQLQRLMRRDRLSADEANERIAAQMTQDEKKRFADHLIDASGSFDSTREQTIAVFEKLRGSYVEETDHSSADRPPRR